MSIDDALDALAVALAAVEVSAWEPPASLDALAVLEAELAPMRLPDPVRRFWQRVDAASSGVQAFVQFCDPEFALWSWRTARDEARSFQPLALVAVGYQSHQYLSVELDVGDCDGGAVFRWDLGGWGFRRVANSLAEWLTHITTQVERGNYRRDEYGGGALLLVPDPDDDDAPWLQSDPVPAAHPVHGTAVNVSDDLLDWPAHWQAANGLDLGRQSLRGATHTIAQVLASDAAQPLSGTIAVRVIDYAGGPWGGFARVEDATGTIDILLPGNRALVPTVVGNWFEIDITVNAGARPVTVDPDAAAAAAGDDPVARIAAVLGARYGRPAAATADAVRRLPAKH